MNYDHEGSAIIADDRRITTIENTADWHATMALKAYRKRQYAEYTRHIRIADQIRENM